MQKHLFFDDNRFFSKENVTRDYGRPELVGEYTDGVVSTDFCTGWVFPTEDGFVSLKTADPSKRSVIATREKIWRGGEMHVNLRARHATLAVYTTESRDEALNILGTAVPLAGYGHEDCIAFSGDSTDWVPRYKSGKRVADLVGKTLVFELGFEGGEIYSFGGDWTDAFNVEAAVYRKHGVLRI